MNNSSPSPLLTASNLPIRDPSTSKRLLLIEDDFFFGAFLNDFLKMRGYSVTLVEDGKQGLERLLAEDFSLIICDIHLPEMTGPELFKRLIEVKPDLESRFIFITGSSPDPTLHEVLTSPREQILTKPFHINSLFDLIEKAEEPFSAPPRRSDSCEADSSFN